MSKTLDINPEQSRDNFSWNQYKNQDLILTCLTQ